MYKKYLIILIFSLFITSNSFAKDRVTDKKVITELKSAIQNDQIIIDKEITKKYTYINEIYSDSKKQDIIEVLDFFDKMEFNPDNNLYTFNYYNKLNDGEIDQNMSIIFKGKNILVQKKEKSKIINDVARGPKILYFKNNLSFEFSKKYNNYYLVYVSSEN